MTKLSKKEMLEKKMDLAIKNLENKDLNKAFKEMEKLTESFNKLINKLDSSIVIRFKVKEKDENYFNSYRSIGLKNILECLKETKEIFIEYTFEGKDINAGIDYFTIFCNQFNAFADINTENNNLMTCAVRKN